MKLNLLVRILSVAATFAVTTLAASVTEATEFTLTYGYPLPEFARAAVPILNEVNSTNRFVHMRQLATSASQSVVRPNVDTLYSTAVIDLSHNDVVVDIPVVEDRYWVFPFYDVYGNNYVNLGSVENSKAGKYILRFNPDEKQSSGVQLFSDPEKRDGLQGYVNSPTPYGLIVVRYAVTNAAGDLQKIHALQNQSRLHTVKKDGRTSFRATVPPLTISLLNSSLPSDPATKIMQLTARIAPHNPPRNISDLERVNNMLREAGIRDGVYEPQKGLNLTAAYLASEVAMAKVASKPQNVRSLGNGWKELAPTVQGDYGENYVMREYVTYTGFLALRATEVLYPSYSTGPEGLCLGPRESYIFTFSSKPPLEQFGFWSLTAYNAEEYLVPNTLNRYALGDRSNLTYADDSLVYDSNANGDRSFQLLVQPADIEPPKNWTSNWLPAPKGGGDISLTLRFYAPTEQLRNGSWPYPVVQKVEAIQP
ncbi:hypothetical protein ASPFODRAFT_220612 [Aspergillus luchuensis CBS 106.47]|uniref:DUF1254 domain-containing protein n=1 Tax=Aspergillus luchuensis (strain CBS 106.47) TaxID=1137211 RepID=A0A1M3TA64_ASPLC|nr:hypothetical protein ASPFODRAFT_220612 [Aspergillus luchuensis CBS 106.47]